MGKSILIVSVIVFILGFGIGHSCSRVEEKIVYQKEYINDPDKVSKTIMNSEIEKAKKTSYDIGYTDGRKIGYDEGTEYGKGLILEQIDLRIEKAVKTDKNVPLFKVKDQ